MLLAVLVSLIVQADSAEIEISRSKWWGGNPTLKNGTLNYYYKITVMQDGKVDKTTECYQVVYLYYLSSEGELIDFDNNAVGHCNRPVSGVFELSGPEDGFEIEEENKLVMYVAVFRWKDEKEIGCKIVPVDVIKSKEPTEDDPSFWGQDDGFPEGEGPE